jgi:UDP-2-acetamido-3-amino-2,3-dideoxy-glucuronate N-acetyltransferase
MEIKIHPNAEVQTSHIGKGTMVWQYCVILKNARIGKNCNINFNVYIENDVIIGDQVTIKSGVQIWDGLRIGNNVFIGPNVTFTNDILPRSKSPDFKLLYTYIGDNVTIGANSTILAGIKIDEFAFIGAGSVVTKNIPSRTLWYGNPASHKGYIKRDGTLLDLNKIDKFGNKYEIIDNEFVLIKL